MISISRRGRALQVGNDRFRQVTNYRERRIVAKQEMLIVKKSYDFSKWLLNHTGKFPRSSRFTVAARLENTMMEFTELVAVANRRTAKRSLLFEADEALTRLRLLVRLSYDMKFLSLHAYEHASLQIAELGKMLGGWIKSVE